MFACKNSIMNSLVILLSAVGILLEILPMFLKMFTNVGFICSKQNVGRIEACSRFPQIWQRNNFVSKCFKSWDTSIFLDGISEKGLLEELRKLLFYTSCLSSVKHEAASLLVTKTLEFYLTKQWLSLYSHSGFYIVVRLLVLW